MRRQSYSRPVGLIACLLAIAMIGGKGHAATGAWQVSETIAALTGAPSVTGSLASTQPLQNMIGAPESAELVLRCSDRVVAAYVAWPQVLSVSGTGFMSQQTQTLVLWRLDNGPIAGNDWDRADSGVAAGKFSTGGAVKLITQFSSAKQLVVRMTGQTTQDAVFDLTGIDEVIGKVAHACGLTATPMTPK